MRKRFLASLLSTMFLLLSGTFAVGQTDAEKALKQFKLSPGLKMTVWASEPMFVNPTCIDIDHKGRVWVCESVNYRCKLRRQPLRRKSGDRIVILADTNDDGKADKATTFYQSPELLAPLGIAVAQDPKGPGRMVFVCQSPYIWVFHDKDGDDKADGPPEVLLKGFQGYDHDHGVHGISIGPDGKLYFSVGDRGVRGLKDKWGRVWSSNNTDCRAGTNWRCNLDGSGLELIAHNFRNQYEPCVTSFGDSFVSDNDDDGNRQTRICHVIPGANYGYHPRRRGEHHWHEDQPGVMPKILRTFFGSPTGICVYEGDLLPKKYRGQVLHTDAGPNHVRCYHMKANGASYSVDREDMVTTPDRKFRPSDVAVGPDGAVYVSDWYDPGVGGHGIADFSKGRIYRITPEDFKTQRINLDLKSKKGIVAALGSPNIATRYMAIAKLNSMPKGEAIRTLEMAAVQQEKPFLRARALWQLGRLGSLRFVNGAFSDEDPRFRVLAMRILNDFHNTSPLDYPEVWKAKLLKDTSGAVRREALVMLRREDPTKARKMILDLAKTYDGEDRYFLACVGIAVGKDAKRREVILEGFSKAFPKWDSTVAGLVWELQPPNVLPLLTRRLNDAKASIEEREKVANVIAGLAETEAGMVLIKAVARVENDQLRTTIVSLLRANLAGRWQKLRQHPELAKMTRRLLMNKKTTPSGLLLIDAGEQTAFVNDVAKIAKDEKASVELRRRAINTLSHLKTEKSTNTLVGITLNEEKTRELVLAAVRALGNQNTPLARKKLQGMATNSKKFSLPERQVAVAGLASTRPGSMWLVKAYQRKALGKDLKEDLSRLLRNSPYRNVRGQAVRIFPPPGKLDPKRLPSIPALLARKGNPGRGRQLMLASLKNKMACLQCHKIQGMGGAVGPDLSVIGKKGSRENLLESILYPSRAINHQFKTWAVQTKKGLFIKGLLVEDTPEQIVLRDANGKDHTIPTKSIQRKAELKESVMPDNLLLFMKEQDLVDIVDYMTTLTAKGLTPMSWRIIGPFHNGKGDTGMRIAYPPEKKIDLEATYMGKSGKVSWKTIMPDENGFFDLRSWLKNRADDTMCYAYCEIISEKAQKARILIGTDDCARLWVNGKKVFNTLAHRAAEPGQDKVDVMLKKGTNRILLKIGNGDGDYGFYFSVEASEELRLAKK